MQPQYFMDVFRQFAVHWAVGDVPPSGALDVDALKRDFLFGTANEHYTHHIEKIMPALLATERAELTDLMHRTPLPVTLLRSIGLDPAALAQLDHDQLIALAAAHPALADWYPLLSAHARAAGGHLALSKRFLFNPQRQRDEIGLGDRPLVSNRRGTTGMDESFLDRLTRMRKDHALAPLRGTPLAARAAEEFPVDDIEVVSHSGLFADGTIVEPELGATPQHRVRSVRGGQRFRRQVTGE
jgi:hypothetical protein